MENLQEKILKKQYKTKKYQRGITLIALVITIIVLLILAGVSIATLTGENGILTQANRAKTETTKIGAEEKVQLEVLGSYGTDGKIEFGKLNDNLKNNIPGLTYKGNEISEDDSNRINELPATVAINGVKVLIKADGNTAIVEIPEGLNIGDTITYTPESATYSWLSKYSGDSEDTTLDNTTDDYKVTNWKVFNINDDGTINLIAAQPTAGTVYLGHGQGYNNAVKLLNDACNTLYGDSAKGISGRSINIEDIERKMTEEALNGTNGIYNYTNAAKYNEQVSNAYISYRNYPSIYAQENLSVINGIKNINGLRMSEQTTFVEKTDGGATNGEVANTTSIQPYQTYWYKDSSFIQSAFEGEGTGESNVNYNLIVSKGTSTNYWIASRCIDAGSNVCRFYVCRVSSSVLHATAGSMDPCFMYYSMGTSGGSSSLALCPIISLNSSLLKGNYTEGWKIE